MANYVPDFTLSPDQLIFNLTNHANGGKFQANDLIFSTPEIINDEHYHDQIGVAARNGAAFDVDVNSCLLRYNRIDVAHLFSVVGFNVFGAYLGAEIDFTNIAADVLAAYQFNISTGFKIEKRGDDYFLVADTDNPAYYNEVIVDVTVPLADRVPVTMLDGFKYDPGSYQLIPKSKVYMGLSESQYNEMENYHYLVRTASDKFDSVSLVFKDNVSLKPIDCLKTVMVDTIGGADAASGGGPTSACKAAVSQFHPIGDKPGVSLSVKMYEFTNRKTGTRRLGMSFLTDTNTSYGEPSSYTNPIGLNLLPTSNEIADIVINDVLAVDDFKYHLFSNNNIIFGRYQKGKFLDTRYVSTFSTGRPLDPNSYELLIGAHGKLYAYDGTTNRPTLAYDPKLAGENFDTSHVPEIIKRDTDGSIWISWPEALRKGRVWRIESFQNYSNWVEEGLSRDTVLLLEQYKTLQGSGAYLYGEVNVGSNYGVLERIELQLIPKA